MPYLNLLAKPNNRGISNFSILTKVSVPIHLNKKPSSIHETCYLGNATFVGNYLEKWSILAQILILNFQSRSLLDTTFLAKKLPDLPKQ